MANYPEISIAIPTFNGINYIRELIEKLLSQKDVTLQILVIDSSSDDGTYEYLESVPQVTLNQIAKSEFSHGGTRNELVKMASAEIIVFLSQDALPVDDFWAKDIIQTFQSMPSEVVALLGNQVPRSRSRVAIAQRIENTFKFLGNEFGTTIYHGDSSAIDRTFGKQPLSFLSDVHVAYRRLELLNTVPFEPVAYAEDQLMALNILNSRKSYAYSGFIKVYHSNDIPLSMYAKRIYDEKIGMHRSLNLTMQDYDKVTLYRAALRNIYLDIKYIFTRKKNQNLIWKVREIILSVFYELASLKGEISASKELLLGS